jgi:hypothetical protein
MDDIAGRLVGHWATTGDETSAVLCVEGGCDKKQHLDTPMIKRASTTGRPFLSLVVYFECISALFLVSMSRAIRALRKWHNRGAVTICRDQKVWAQTRSPTRARASHEIEGRINSHS